MRSASACPRPTARREPAAEPAHALQVLAGVAVALLGGEAQALEHLELRLAQLERALRDLALQHPAVGRRLAAPAGLEGVAGEDGPQGAERERHQRPDDRDDDAVVERDLRRQRGDRTPGAARPRS